MQTKQNYTNVMNFFTGVIESLIKQKKLSYHDGEIMAAELCLPVSVWLNLCDREPEREEEIIELIERHVRHFLIYTNIIKTGGKLCLEQCEERTEKLT